MKDYLRLFEKLYTRNYPLFWIDIWGFSDAEMTKLTEGKYESRPLFINKGDHFVNVFYDMTSPEGNPELFANYFLTHSDKYHSLLDNFEVLLTRAEDRESVGDLKESLSLLLTGRPGVDAAFTMDLQDGKPEYSDMVSAAVSTRVKTETRAYILLDKLIERLSGLSSLYQKYSNVIRLDEILKETIPNEDELARRSHGWWWYDGKIQTNVEISEIEKQLNIHLVVPYVTKISEFKGAIAQKGSARGVARLILSMSDLTKIQDGDIIVAPMTRPDYLPAMQRASAFITDEGGIVCHAAIVAREFKKPCIVGTKIATQIIKDGDFIEVDADNGIVRILNK